MKGALLLLVSAIVEAAAPNYPVTLRLHLSEETIRARFRPSGLPIAPDWTIPIGEQTRDSYSDIIAKMFRAVPPGAAPELQLDVSVARAELRPTMGGWVAEVEHGLVLTSATGIELGRWALSGTSLTLNAAPEALADALARASDEAASRLPLKFDESDSVRNWLAERGVPPADLRGRLAGRARFIGFLDVGTGMVGGGDGYNGAFLARLGFETPWLLAQLTGGRWSGSFVPSPVFGKADGETQLGTWELGGDLGAVARLGSSLEGRLGGGAHLLWGRANTTYFLRPPLDLHPTVAFSFHRWTPAIFVAVQYSDLVIASATRARLGLEFRRFFNSSVHFAELRRTIFIAENFFGIFIGAELPGAGRSPVRSADGFR